MSVPRPASPAKLVVGVFLKERPLIRKAAAELIAAFGSLDMVSPWLAFDRTDYYEPEMGGPLFRRLMAFKTPVEQDGLADIKLATNAIEARFSVGGKRRMNIDPGCLLRERFVLASGKNFTHRIYLGKGIYADLTLVYRRGRFETLPWTYPDYAAEPMLDWLGRVRRKYVRDLQEAASPGGASAPAPAGEREAEP